MAGSHHFLEPLLRKTGPGLVLGRVGHDRPVATRLTCAFDSASRRRGLLGRDGLDPGEALVIVPCNGVHSFRMRFPIDVIYADRVGRVVKVRTGMAANRISFAARAFATIEMAAGAAAEAGVAAGDVLEVRAR